MDKNWSITETKNLFSYTYTASKDKKGLMWAFSKMSNECGKSVNSVRNYYYSQLKMFELIPQLAVDLGIKIINVQRDRFALFKDTEIVELVQEILINKAKGISVRATINVIAKDDNKKALRLQNKYRSMVSNHKDRVTAIMEEMLDSGVEHYNPYTKSISTRENATDNHAKLLEYIEGLDKEKIDSVFEIFKKLFA